MPAFTTKELLLAFSRHVLDQIARADETIAIEEKAFLEFTCPPDAMEAARFTTEGRLNRRFREARLEALERLPTELDLAAKLELVSTFLDMCIVDGQLDAGEGSLLYRAAELLEVTPSQFDAHLESLTEHVGSVELGEPEG